MAVRRSLGVGMGVGTRVGAVLLAGVSCGAMLAGCAHNPGGPQRSIDMFTLESTTYEPKTVKVVDLRDGSEVWSADVPVGSKITFRFFDGLSDDEYNPDVLRWSIVPTTVNASLLTSEIPVPPAWARRFEWELRRGPETDPSFAPGGVVPAR